MNETFVDLGKQQQLIDDLKASNTSVRVRCLNLFMSLCRTNNQVSWLGKSIQAPWLDTFEKAKQKMGSVSEGDIWNQCSRSKTIIEKTIGKDAMFSVLRGDEPAPKKQKKEN